MRNYKNVLLYDQNLLYSVNDIINLGVITKLLAVFIICLCFSTSAFGKILTSANFDNGQVFSDGWRVHGNNKVSSKSSPVCAGQYAAEFLLNTNFPANRTELVGGRYKNFEYGKEYWVGFAVYLDNGWNIDNSRASDEVIWQLHGAPDKNLGETYRKALLTLNVSGDKWVLRSGWCGTDSTKKVCGRNEVKKQSANIGRVEPGKWAKFAMRIKLSYRNDGVIQLWKDGNAVVNMRGPNAFNDNLGPFMKFGMYKSSWGNSQGQKASGFRSRRLFFDSVIVGDGNESLQSITPKCGNSSSSSLQPPKSLMIQQ